MRWDIIIGLPIGPLKIGPCLGPARRAGVTAQALRGYRAGPALSTIDRASGRARVVLFRVVPRAANRARPIWNTIQVTSYRIKFYLLRDQKRNIEKDQSATTDVNSWGVT
jgi:hypothetical protein